MSIYQKISRTGNGCLFSIFFLATEAIAIKAFSIAVLQKLAKLYPEIINEIKLIIQERWDYETPAFKARAKKLLKNFLSKSFCWLISFDS
jgi:hypothetical protein